MTRHLSRFIAVALCGLAGVTVARATCFPSRAFGQSSIDGQYHYVVFPSGSPATPQSILGRFWQPGQFQNTNQGSCDDSVWLHPCNDDCPSVPSPSFWIDGVIGAGGCQTECIAGEMLLLLEERGTLGGLFAVARVDEGGGFLFDFSRLGRDIGLTSIPKPQVTSTQLVGSILRVGFRFDDPAPGFYGLSGVPATGTITAINLYSRVAASPNPPRERSGWTFRARFPYVGGQTTGSFDFAGGEFCPGGGYIFALAAALELDGGQVVTDYVSAPLAPHCIPETGSGASRVVGDGADALHVARGASGDLTLSWGAVCMPLDARYSVYEGAIGDWTSHAPRMCAAIGTTALLTPSPSDSYYLVVPFALNTLPPEEVEGSYGLLGDGSERAPSAAACAQRWVQECP